MWPFNRKTKSINNVSTNTIQQLCEILRPKLGSQYSDETSTKQYRSWVYVAATHNATNVADAEVKLFTNKNPLVSNGKHVSKRIAKQYNSGKFTSDTQEIEDHPILDLLLSPNPHDSLYSFIYKIDLFLELTGDSYVLIERNEAGIPIALYVLYSQYINIQYDCTGVTGYTYGISDRRFQYRYAPEDIIHFRFFDPDDVYYGISPLEASARSYGLIKSMDTYEEAINRNMGVPSGILNYKDRVIHEKQREDAEKKWQQKFASVGRAGKLLVTGTEVNYQDIGISPRDMQFLDGRKWSREDILSCYGVPQALLLTDDVNRSNMITASINYYHNTIRPRCKLISETLTRELIHQNGLDGSSLFVVLHKDSPQDIELKLKEMKLLSDKGAVTINELRNKFNYEQLDDPTAEELIKVKATSIVKGDEDAD
jgi:HK97 family phage portal protein